MFIQFFFKAVLSRNNGNSFNFFINGYFLLNKNVDFSYMLRYIYYFSSSNEGYSNFSAMDMANVLFNWRVNRK